MESNNILITLILEITFNIKCILVPIKSVDYYKFKKPYMDWIQISQNPYIEVLNFSVTVCGDEAFKAVGWLPSWSPNLQSDCMWRYEAFKAITVTAVMKP